ncbi:DUF2442 domain-containing protein [candidate division KSB1 bacterium]|nr:DUF2442 domain-containing protein [candidate division KSB1 bacterium]
MKKYHKIEWVQFMNEKLKIRIDGDEHEFELSVISKKLTNASHTERAKYQISPSGYGIHWPLIDEDLSIDGLLGIKHTSSNIKKTVQI